MTIIKAMLRAGLFAALFAVPGLASADDNPNECLPATEKVPDHQQAETQSGDLEHGCLPATPRGVPDHQEAETRGGDSSLGAQNQGLEPQVPDHQEAEARGPVEK